MVIWKNCCIAAAGIAGGAFLLTGLLQPAPSRPDPETESATTIEGRDDENDDSTAAPDSQTYDDIRAVARNLDRAFEARWHDTGIEPAPPAPPLLVARRLSLALTGTVPSLEELRELRELRLLELVDEAERIDWWVRRLLADRRSANYLAERFARSYVGVENGPFLVFRRRRMVDWLSEEIHQNRPYDQLVRRLITAEGVWTSEPEVNFVTVTVDQNNDEEGPDEVKLAARVSRAFLGIRMDCVQCHDDMFGDRWKQRDFHQLAAFFAGTDMSLTGVRDSDKAYKFRYKRQPEAETVPPLVPFQDELLPAEGKHRERLAAWVTHPDNAPFSRALVNRVWAILFNRSLTPAVDDIPLEGPFPTGMELLADDLVAHEFDLQRLIRVIAQSRVFQLESRPAEAAVGVNEDLYVDLDVDDGDEGYSQHAVFPLTRLRPEQVAGAIIQAASIKTIDADSHILKRFVRLTQQGDFIKRFGDLGEDEFGEHAGTIPQRLAMMNGKLVWERTKKDLVMNASTRIGALASTDALAVESAYLTVLTRRPSPEESAVFESWLQGAEGDARAEAMEDLYWTLFNSTEFSWNH